MLRNNENLQPLLFNSLQDLKSVCSRLGAILKSDPTKVLSKQLIVLQDGDTYILDEIINSTAIPNKLSVLCAIEGEEPKVVPLPFVSFKWKEHQKISFIYNFSLAEMLEPIIGKDDISLDLELPLCPIQYSELLTPIITPNGKSYNPSTIIVWLKANRTDPGMTGGSALTSHLIPGTDKTVANPLTFSDLLINHSLQSLIMLVIQGTKPCDFLKEAQDDLSRYEETIMQFLTHIEKNKPPILTRAELMKLKMQKSSLEIKFERIQAVLDQVHDPIIRLAREVGIDPHSMELSNLMKVVMAGMLVSIPINVLIIKGKNPWLVITGLLLQQTAIWSFLAYGIIHLTKLATMKKIDSIENELKNTIIEDDLIALKTIKKEIELQKMQFTTQPHPLSSGSPLLFTPRQRRNIIGNNNSQPEQERSMVQESGAGIRR